MINKPNKQSSMDLQKFKQDTSTLIYLAIPRGKEVVCEGPSATKFRYELFFRIHEAACQMISEALTKGKACWYLQVNPDKTSEIPFNFRPKGHLINDFEAVPMVIRSRDMGVPSRNVRSLVKRIRRSEIPLSDLSLLKFDDDRRKIADRWGHSLAWRISDPSAFTDASILINQCNMKLLAIRACKTVEVSMNEALSKTEFSDYTISIPTYSKEELESAAKRYVEGELEEGAFSKLVFSRE